METSSRHSFPHHSLHHLTHFTGFSGGGEGYMSLCLLYTRHTKSCPHLNLLNSQMQVSQAPSAWLWHGGFDSPKYAFAFQASALVDALTRFFCAQVDTLTQFLCAQVDALTQFLGTQIHALTQFLCATIHKCRHHRPKALGCGMVALTHQTCICLSSKCTSRHTHSISLCTSRHTHSISLCTNTRTYFISLCNNPQMQASQTQSAWLWQEGRMGDSLQVI